MTQIVSILQKDFSRLSEFIQNEYGIKMPEVKKTLLESRLQKRLRKLEIKTFKEYCDFLFSRQGMEEELPHFIDKITTNKTDFYRESEHFDYLTAKILPAIIKKDKREFDTIRIWSAGCSTGEEPYTIAMVVKDFLDTNKLDNIRLSILATDISYEVLRVAKRAIYHEIRAVPIPFPIKKKYLLKSKSGEKKLIKIAPEIRELITFGRLNFMEQNYGLREKMDIIFCRNVIIYFDKPTQEIILNRIVDNLIPGGFFLQGHSETIQGIELPLKQVFPTVYIKSN